MTASLTSPASAAALACELRRLWFNVNAPHVFDERKRELAARIAALAAPSPCSSCLAQSLRHALDAARRTSRAAEARAVRAERLLASARPRRRRSRVLSNPKQLELWT